MNERLASIHLLLWINLPRGQEHSDKHIEQTWWLRSDGRGGPVGAPFVDNHDDEVSEDTVEKENLGDEFCPDRERVTKVKEVGQL